MVNHLSKWSARAIICSSVLVLIFIMVGVFFNNDLLALCHKVSDPKMEDFFGVFIYKQYLYKLIDSLAVFEKYKYF